MILVGQINIYGSIPSHIDDDEYLNVVFSIGDNSMIGGDILYYDGSEKKIMVM